MKSKKLSILMISAITLSGALGGCSTMWSGVSDFADFMSEETKFLSLRKSSAVKEVVLQQPAGNPDGVYRTNVGNYVPMSSTGMSHTGMTHTGMVHTGMASSNLAAECPDGSYLTPENTCMMTEPNLSTYDRVASVQTTPTPNIFNPTTYLPSSMIAPVQDCPEDTYLTPQKTCMRYEDNSANLMASTAAANPSVISVAASVAACPEGTFLSAENKCQVSAELIPEIYLRGTMGVTDMGLSTNSSCPDNTYKDADNFCMRMTH